MASEKDDKKVPDPRELFMQLQYLQSIYSQQYEVLNQSIENYTSVQETLRDNIVLLESSKRVSGKDALIPTEGGMYFPAGVKNFSTVITYIGAGYLAEKGIGDAKQFFEDKISKGDDLINKLANQRQKVREELAEINYRMSALQSQGMLE